MDDTGELAAAEPAAALPVSAPAPEAPEPEPTGRPTARSEAYLAYLSRAGPTVTIRQACRRLHLSEGSITNWRKNVKGFRARELEIRARQAAVVGTEDAPLEPTGPCINEDGLSPQQVIYLRALARERGHRTNACQRAGVPWADVQVWLKTRPRFADEFSLVREEVRIGCEDAIGEKGLKGDVPAARMTLDRMDGKSGGGGGNNGSGGGGNSGLTGNIDGASVRETGVPWLLEFVQQIEAGNGAAPPEVPVPAPAEQAEEEETEQPDLVEADAQ